MHEKSENSYPNGTINSQNSQCKFFSKRIQNTDRYTDRIQTGLVKNGQKWFKKVKGTKLSEKDQVRRGWMISRERNETKNPNTIRG